MPTLTRFDTKKIYKTPIGEAVWPKLIEPERKFDSAGVYEIRVKFSAEDERQFLSEMMSVYDAAYEEMRIREAKTSLPRELPPWKEGKDGRLEFKFKLKASGIFNGQPWSNKPPKLFDSTTAPIENPDPQKFKFGAGTLVRVFFQAKPFFVQKAGVTFRLRAVQIVKFVPYNDVAYFGLSEEHDESRYVHHIRVTVDHPTIDGMLPDLPVNDVLPESIPEEDEEFTPTKIQNPDDYDDYVPA